jgi:hypothetical protein
MSDTDSPGQRLNGPPETDAAARVARQRELGLSNVPDARFDDFARKLVELTGAPAAMVNLVGDERQYFAGLHVNTDTAPGEPAFLGDPGREMDLEHGFCPHVVARKKALVLDDIFAYPRFAGNPVVDEIGVRSYLGAPLIDDDGTVIGTVCAVDPAPRGSDTHGEWGKRGLEAIKAVASEVVAEIHARQRVGKILATANGPVLVASSPALAVLHVNSLHERMFGAAAQLGEPASSTFPVLGSLGVIAAMERVARTREPATSASVPLAGGSGTVLFASVPTSVPGQDQAVLTLGLRDSDAATCVSSARELASQLGVYASRT